MQAVTAQPSQALLQRVDRPDSHDTRKPENASQSAFASYAFGPMDLHQGQAKTAKRDDASGVGFGRNPLSAASLSAITATQEVGAGGDSAGSQRRP